MSNLRLWGYTNQNTAQANTSLGLLDKLNKLKVEINKLRDEDNDEQIEEIETTLNQHEQELTTLYGKFNGLPYSNDIDNLQKLLGEFIEKFHAFKTEIETQSLQHDQNIMRKTDELESTLNQQVQTFESLQSQVETIADNFIKFMGKFQTFKTDIQTKSLQNHQILIRRIGELQGKIKDFSQTKTSHTLIILQISSKMSKLSANKKVMLMNNAPYYDVPINFRLKQMKIYSSDNLIHGRPVKFTIHLDTRILITAWGPFSKTFDIERDINKGQKICFMPNTTINSGLYCELIGQAL